MLSERWSIFLPHLGSIVRTLSRAIRLIKGKAKKNMNFSPILWFFRSGSYRSRNDFFHPCRQKINSTITPVSHFIAKSNDDTNENSGEDTVRRKPFTDLALDIAVRQGLPV